MYDILQLFFCFWWIFGTLPAFQEGYFDGFAEKNWPSKAWTEITFSLDPKCSTCKMFQRSFILNSGLFWRKPKGRWGCFSGANCFLFEFFVYLQKMVCIFFEKHIPEWWVQIIPMQIDPTSTECRGGNVPIQTRPIIGDVHMKAKRENRASFFTKWGDSVVGKMIYWTICLQVVLTFSRMVIFITGKPVWRNPGSFVLLVPKHP